MISIAARKNECHQSTYACAEARYCLLHFPSTVLRGTPRDRLLISPHSCLGLYSSGLVHTRSASSSIYKIMALHQTALSPIDRATPNTVVSSSRDKMTFRISTPHEASPAQEERILVLTEHTRPTPYNATTTKISQQRADPNTRLSFRPWQTGEVGPQSCNNVPPAAGLTSTI